MIKKLLAYGDCGIDDKGIKNVNLVYLFVDDNPKITNVNHMKDLKSLHASGYCGIDDYGISGIHF